MAAHEKWCKAKRAQQAANRAVEDDMGAAEVLNQGEQSKHTTCRQFAYRSHLSALRAIAREENEKGKGKRKGKGKGKGKGNARGTGTTEIENESIRTSTSYFHGL